jgi:hypothetical protein
MKLQIVFQPGNQARAERAYHYIKSAHMHTAMMAKTDQNDAAVGGILNVSAHANALQSGLPAKFRSRILFLGQLYLQTSEGTFKQKELT